MWGGQRTIVELDDEDGAVRQKMWERQQEYYGNVIQMARNAPFSAKKTLFRGEIHCCLKEKQYLCSRKYLQSFRP